MLTIAKIAMHGTFCFAIENVADPLVFKKKLCFKDVFSDRKPRVERQFHSKREWYSGMTSSQTSQNRDLAKVDDFETLSL